MHNIIYADHLGRTTPVPVLLDILTPRTSASSSCDSIEEVDLSTVGAPNEVLVPSASTASDPPLYTQMQLEYLENEIQ